MKRNDERKYFSVDARRTPVRKIELHHSPGNGVLEAISMFDWNGNCILNTEGKSGLSRSIELGEGERVIGIRGRMHPEKYRLFANLQFIVCKFI